MAQQVSRLRAMYRNKSFSSRLSDLIFLELKERWNRRWFFELDQDWETFVLNLAERLDVTAELDDPVARELFEAYVIDAGRLLKQRGLIRVDRE
jgi:hypothetical protein